MASLDECLNNILGSVATINGGPLEISAVLQECIPGPINKVFHMFI